MEDWVGIYKGLRLPILGVALMIITWLVYRRKNKKMHEDIRFDMLDDDIDGNISEQARARMNSKSLK